MALADPEVLVGLPPRLLGPVLEGQVVQGDRKDLAHPVPPSVLETARGAENNYYTIYSVNKAPKKLEERGKVFFKFSRFNSKMYFHIFYI